MYLDSYESIAILVNSKIANLILLPFTTLILNRSSRGDIFCLNDIGGIFTTLNSLRDGGLQQRQVKSKAYFSHKNCKVHFFQRNRINSASPVLLHKPFYMKDNYIPS